MTPSPNQSSPPQPTADAGAPAETTDSLPSWLLYGLLLAVGYWIGAHKLSPAPVPDPANHQVPPPSLRLPDPACPADQLPDDGYCVPIGLGSEPSEPP